MKKSNKIILSVVSACTFVAILVFNFAIVNNNGNAYNVGGSAKVNGQPVIVDEQTSSQGVQNNDDGLKPVVNYKINSKTDIKSLPAPKAGESHILKGESKEDNLFYVGPEAGVQDTPDFENFSEKNTKNETACVYWGINSEGTLVICDKEKGDASQDASNFNNQTGDAAPAWHGKYQEIKAVSIQTSVGVDLIKPPSTKSWFSDATTSGWAHSPRIKWIDGLDKIDMTGVTNASYMFCGLNYDQDFKMTSIPKWGKETLNLTSLEKADGMFACTGTSDEAGAFNCAFDGEVKLTSGDGTVAKLHTTKAMFQGADMITGNTVDLSKLSMKDASDAGYMFHNANNIVNLKLGEVSGDKLIRARSMFNHISSLKDLDITKWSTSLPNPQASGFDYIGVFQNEDKLEKIHVQAGFDWSSLPSDKTAYMFYGDTSLTGKDGTSLIKGDDGKDVVDSTYAKVDYAQTIVDATGNQPKGYFTATQANFVVTGAQINAGDKHVIVYYDDKCHKEVNNTVYACPIKAAPSADVIPWKGIAADVVDVAYDGTFNSGKLAPMDYWFAGFIRLTNPPEVPRKDGETIEYSTGLYKGATQLKIHVVPNYVSKIGNGCFEGCTNLKKILVGDASEPVALSNVGAKAFDGCTSLENFVITGATNSATFDEDAFIGAGGSNPINSAPLIVADVNGESAASAQKVGIRHYTFTKVTGRTQISELNNNYYYFLMNGVNTNKNLIGTKEGASVDCVIDLHGNSINRSQDSSLAGGQVIIVRPKGHLRIDDTSTLDTANVGQIKGGFQAGDATEHNNSLGGGLYVCGKLDFVNGCICNNKARLGAAIGIENSEVADSEGMVNIYSGLIKGNESKSQNNQTYYGGGAIIARNNSFLNIYGGNITENLTATAYGGAIYGMASSNVNIMSGSITNNKVTTNNGQTVSDIYCCASIKGHVSRSGSEDSGRPCRAFINESLTGYKLQDGFGVQKCSIDANGFATVSGAATTGKIETLYIPNQLGSIKVKGIKASAYSGQTSLRKVVLEKPLVSNYSVGNSAFSGCTYLENFVVRTAEDSGIVYGTKVFENSGLRMGYAQASTVAGAQNSTEGAPFVVAGGVKEIEEGYKAKEEGSGGKSTTGGIGIYYYSEIAKGARASRTSAIQLGDDTRNYYYYLAGDQVANASDNAQVFYVVKGNVVIDLAGRTVNRNLESGKSDGPQAIQCGVNDITKGTSMTRIDNTAALNASCKNESYGKITGGFNTSNTGGGIYCYDQLALVNCCITGNKAVYGGGVCMTPRKNGSMLIDNCPMPVLYMYNNAIIYKNMAYSTSANTNGGGICMRYYSYLFMYGGKVIGNTSQTTANASARGGGIALITQWSSCQVAADDETQYTRAIMRMFGSAQVGALSSDNTDEMNSAPNIGAGIFAYTTNDPTPKKHTGVGYYSYVCQHGGYVLYNKLGNANGGLGSNNIDANRYRCMESWWKLSKKCATYIKTESTINVSDWEDASHQGSYNLK